METIPGPNNWLLTVRRDGNAITLLRCATPDADAVLPETLWGLPVTILADHALAPRPVGTHSPLSTGTRPADGQAVELRFTCGNSGDRPWDNSSLRTLTLPPALGRVENYALYHCHALERLRLYDSAAFWGSGVLTGCPSLKVVEITQSADWSAERSTEWPAEKSAERITVMSTERSADRVTDRFAEWPTKGITERPTKTSVEKSAETPVKISVRNFSDYAASIISPGGTLAYFAGEVNGELEVIVSTPDGPLLRLIFPAYREVYEENTPAHHFDFVIEGAGYPYHHCFRSRVIHLPTYDSFWPRFRESADPCAVRLAWWRVRYPVELSAEAGAAYWSYLLAHARETVSWLIQEQDIRGLAFYLGQGKHGRDLFTYALDLAREQRLTEVVALLLDEQRRHVSVQDRFAL